MMDAKASLQAIRESELFDPSWYEETYKDVPMLGMDSAEHFLKYGAMLRRDPGPKFSTAFYSDVRCGKIEDNLNPLVHFLTSVSPAPPAVTRVLLSANAVATNGNHALAMDLAERHLPPELQYTLGILLANEAQRQGDEVLWLTSLNAYLSEFGLRPIELGDGGTLLSRLRCDRGRIIHDGPLISVIMAARNAENDVEAAARSILDQTWHNLELLIVDDASTDETWRILERVAASDSRVRIFQNHRNVGPYVSKNLALQHAKGDWITGQDADDWSHPQRIEKHLTAATSDANRPASITHMIRLAPDGVFSHIRPITSFSFDGVATKASVSCLYERDFLRQRLGHWDSVRFGADSEMIARASTLLGSEVPSYRMVNMLCLDIPTSLTNDTVTGVRLGKMSPARAAYRAAYTEWHSSGFRGQGAFIPFLMRERFFDADPCMVVRVEDCQATFDHHGL